MGAAGQSICRVGGLALLTVVATVGPSTAAPPPAPCLPYAPVIVDLTGVLQREAFAQVPIADLFVDPNDREVGEEPEAPGTGDAPPPAASESSPPLASAPPPASGIVVVDAAFIGPPMPASADAGAAIPVVDPVLMRARPANRPPKSEQVWVLALRPDVCVAADPTDRVNTSEKRVRKLQLVIDKGEEPSLRPMQKKKVVVHGQLFHAVSRRHYLPVLINVETVRPPEWIPEMTELQPLQTTPR